MQLRHLGACGPPEDATATGRSMALVAEFNQITTRSTGCNKWQRRASFFPSKSAHNFNDSGGCFHLVHQPLTIHFLLISPWFVTNINIFVECSPPSRSIRPDKVRPSCSLLLFQSFLCLGPATGFGQTIRRPSSPLM